MPRRICGDCHALEAKRPVLTLQASCFGHWVTSACERIRGPERPGESCIARTVEEIGTVRLLRPGHSALHAEECCEAHDGAKCKSDPRAWDAHPRAEIHRFICGETQPIHINFTARLMPLGVPPTYPDAPNSEMIPTTKAREIPGLFISQTPHLGRIRTFPSGRSKTGSKRIGDEEKIVSVIRRSHSSFAAQCVLMKPENVRYIRCRAGSISDGDMFGAYRRRTQCRCG